jgi:hypothetical protein
MQERVLALRPHRAKADTVITHRFFLRPPKQLPNIDLFLSHFWDLCTLYPLIPLQPPFCTFPLSRERYL